MLPTLRIVLARALVTAGRVIVVAPVLMGAWVVFRGASATQGESTALGLLFALAGVSWPMLLLPIASAALVTVGSRLTAETVLGTRHVAEPRVVHVVPLPLQLSDYRVEVVLGTGWVIVVSSGVWDGPGDYHVVGVQRVIQPWWVGWLVLLGWFLGFPALTFLGWGLIVLLGGS